MTDITYDPDADAAVRDSAEVAPGVVIDYDEAGRVVGIELLNAGARLAPGGSSRARRPPTDEALTTE